MNWTAIGAVSTAAGVVVALFYPLWRRWRRLNKVERLIEREIKANREKIKNIKGGDVDLPTGQTIGALERNQFLVSAVDIQLWKQYRYELAEHRPDKFQLYRSVNRYAEAILEAPSKSQEEVVLTLLKSESDSFLEKCEELGIGVE